MITLSSIISTFEAPFLAQYGESLLPSQRQALAALNTCRTPQSPRMLAQCTECHQHELAPHSCGHRSCPHCQHHESQQWLERQLKRQLPAEYFLVTFTIPRQLRSLVWHHQRQLYGAMIRCSWETIRTFAQHDKALGGTPGAIAVLHTHSRRLDYHPHVHLVVPAAVVDSANRWRTKGTAAKPAHYLFNHKALAKVFRAKFLNAIDQAALTLPRHYPRKWVVDAKSVGSGQPALTYLGRYLYRGVIQERDIIANSNGQVTFRYKDGKTKRLLHKTVSGVEFLHLILQHVLPKGFRRARNFGLLHPNSKRLIALIHYVTGFDPAQIVKRIITRRPTFTCHHCGSPMKIIATRLRPITAFCTQ
jgi:hypothetical protein